MRPAGEWAQEWKNECEIEKEFEMGRVWVMGLNDDPIREQQERGREDNEIIDCEMGSDQDGG